MRRRDALKLLGWAAAGWAAGPDAGAQVTRPGRARGPAGDEATFPPRLPGGRAVVTDRAEEFLRPPATLRDGVAIARTPPTIDLMLFPGQDYPGNPWSAWGDSLVAPDGTYYASIGDHLAPGGNAFVYAYEPGPGRLRRLLDLRAVLGLPEGHYTPGKIHGRLDLGADGWLYFATHRGSPRATTAAYHYRGDWILRHHPPTGRTEVVARAPIPGHSIPASVLDPERLIFYGGTAAGVDNDEPGIRFFAYDVRGHRLLHAGPDGPSRYLALARSTGRVYYTAGREDGPLMRFDPEAGGPPLALEGRIGIRAATGETPQGVIYTVSQGQRGAEAILYALDTRSERVEALGPAAVGGEQYIASLDADPSGCYLYYIPGAHGGSAADGAAVVQLDVQSRRRKVVAFLHPYYRDRYGLTPRGTYSSAVSPDGGTLYVTWNASRGGRAWDCCALTAIRIPESERRA